MGPLETALRRVLDANRGQLSPAMEQLMDETETAAFLAGASTALSILVKSPTGATVQSLIKEMQSIRGKIDV